MAKRRQFNKTRVFNINANRRLRSVLSRPRYSFPKLTSYEDFRRWEPVLTDDQYPRSFPQSLSRVRRRRSRSDVANRSMAMPRLFRQISTGLEFTRPERVVLCVRRSIRKQVLHAFRKAGKAGQKRPRRTPNSLISCGG